MKSIHLRAILALGLVLGGTVAVRGQEAIKSLKYPPLNQIEVPKPTKVKLDNGLTLYLIEDHSLPKVSFMVEIHRCGGYLDPSDKVGLARMTGAVMRTGGAGTLTGDQVDETLEGIGATIESGMDQEGAEIQASGLSESTGTIVRTMAEILRHPAFNPDKIELEKTDQRTEISRRNDEPMGIAIREFTKVLYGPDSPYSRRVEYATVDAVTRDDMIRFHETYVVPNHAQIAAWGDFRSKDMIALLKKQFGDWPRGKTEAPPPPDVTYQPHPSISYVEKTDVDQTIVLAGHIGGRMNDPDYAAATVMNSVLGESFGSRLFRIIRTKMGLAYATGGAYTFDYDHPGVFYSYVMTKSGTTVKAIRALLDQIRSMQTVPATDDEMSLAKDGYLNSFVFHFDEKQKIISRLMEYDYYKMPADYLQQTKTAVEKISPEDVLAVSKRKIDPDNLRIVVVGNQADFDSSLAVLGPVAKIDISIPQPKTAAVSGSDQDVKAGQALLGKAAQACGGVAALRKVESMRMDANVSVKTPQGEMSLQASLLEVLPDKMVQTVKTPMGDQTIVLNGSSGWVTSMGKSQALPASQLDDYLKQLRRELVWLLAQADQPSFLAVSHGTETFEGKPALRLDVQIDPGNQLSLFLDPKTYLPAGMKYTGATMAGPGEVVETYGDFRDYQGIKLPARSVEKSGPMETTTDVSTVEMNGKIDPGLFVKPAGL